MVTDFITRAGRTGRRTSTMRVAVLAPVLLMAGSVTAQDTPPTPSPSTVGRLEVPPLLPAEDEVRAIAVDPAVARLADRLGDPSYLVREEAMETLLGTPGDPRQICALLANDALSAEQRYRLLMVLESHLLHAPRGAVGISMDWSQRSPDEPGEVVIAQLIPGLPAERVLQLGDRISAVDGRALFARRDLVILVQTKQPGDEVTLTVRRPRRDGQGHVLLDDDEQVVFDTLTTTLRLGSTRQLTGDPAAVGTVSGDVEELRTVEASEARRRYAPRPRPVEIHGVTAVDG